MDLNEEITITVTREFEWNVDMCLTYVVSEIFEISLGNNVTKWQLILYRDYENVYAFLRMIESATKKFGIDLTINSLKLNDKQCNRKYDAEFFDDAWLLVHTLKYINPYVSGDLSCTFSLQIKISLTQNQPKAVDCCGAKRMLSNYSKLFNTDKLSDLKLICSDGKEIPAHRFVLIAHSPVMYKMLMSESQKQTIQLDDVDSETMLEVLRFLYTGKVENIANLEADLLKFAEKYELKELPKIVTQSMTNNMSVDNVLEYYKLADIFKAEVLMEKCVFFIQNNYHTLQQQEGWGEFDPKMKTLLKHFAMDGCKNPVFIIKSLASYEKSKLPKEYKPYSP